MYCPEQAAPICAIKEVATARRAVVKTSIHSLVRDPRITTSNEETFLQNFLAFASELQEKPKLL